MVGLIARTNGATSGTPIEIRRGVLEDIAEADRSNWVDCNVIPPNISNPESTITTHQEAEIQPDGSVNVWYVTATIPSYFLVDNLLRYAAEKRWKNMQKGLVLNGVKVDTSDSSFTKLGGAIRELEKGTFTSVRWKTAGGEKVELGLAELEAIHSAIAVFVQANYDAEFDVIDQIQAGTITTRAQIDAYAWP